MNNFLSGGYKKRILLSMEFEKPNLILRINKSGTLADEPAPAGAVGVFLSETPLPGGDPRIAWVNSALNCDYMGSAEFEWGEIPRAFHELACLGKDGLLTEIQMVLEGAPSLDFRSTDNPDAMKMALKREAVGWLLCPTEFLDDVKIVLDELAQSNLPKTFRPQEIPFMQRGLFGIKQLPN